ncbi:zinc ribbon domain-containing protein [Secundilactobacillus similis]|uniref:Zinc-ribbon domain-containing protein n=1 Tax=Secundilactobacillus similis DSM 23365 = JCM 2765 TaxID=1423804 RepID=A0A0R2EYE6_9LACO|nr:zinc ribbon domain-containing protein [Secundilactobacillus similis]KRN21369.1 hypothetical protein FD14_GL001111 [Secundilactobacillus similis DSM 23365 = JCM 2765]
MATDGSGDGQATMFCPNCGTKVLVTDAFCANCGAELAAFRPNTSADAPQQNAPEPVTPRQESQPQSASEQAERQPAEPRQDAQPQSAQQPVAPRQYTPQQSMPERGGQQPTPAQSVIQQPAQPAQPVPHRAATRPRQPRSKGQRIGLIAGAIVVVLLVILGVMGNNYYSKANTIKRIVTAAKGNQASLADYFYTTDPTFKVTKTSLKPMVRYLQQDPAALNQFQEGLTNSGQFEKGHLLLTQHGHHFLVFPKYQVQVRPVYVSVTVNKKNAKLKQDDQLIATSTSADYTKKIGPLVPGLYNLASSAKISGRQLTNTNTYHLNQDNQTIPLTLKTITFDVDGPAGTEVMINSQRQGKIDSSGVLTLKDFPWTDQMKIQGVYRNGKTVVKSQPVALDESTGDPEVSIDFPGLVDQADADTFFNNLGDATSILSNTGDIDQASDDDGDDLSTFFAGGDSDSNYQEFVKMGKGYYDDDDIDGTEITASIDNVQLSSQDSSDVTFEFKYKFDNGDHYHVQVFKYTANVIVRDNSDYPLQIKSLTPAQSVDTYNEDE